MAGQLFTATSSSTTPIVKRPLPIDNEQTLEEAPSPRKRSKLHPASWPGSYSIGTVVGCFDFIRTEACIRICGKRKCRGNCMQDGAKRPSDLQATINTFGTSVNRTLYYKTRRFWLDTDIDIRIAMDKSIIWRSFEKKEKARRAVNEANQEIMVISDDDGPITPTRDKGKRRADL